MIWNEKMECADRDTMRSVQLEKLKKTVKHAYDNVSHYRNKMDEAGVKPEDIKSLDDITKLPFITKEDIAANYPTGLFAEPMKDIVRIHASSGTTGKPKIVGYTRNDLDMWGECVARGMTMAGASQESVVHVSYGSPIGIRPLYYGYTEGGAILFASEPKNIQKLTSRVMPFSPGTLIIEMDNFTATAIRLRSIFLQRSLWRTGSCRRSVIRFGTS